MSQLLASDTLYIKEFEFEIALRCGERREYEYEFDGVTPKAEVEVGQGDYEEEWKGDRALSEVLALFARLAIRADSNPLEVAGRALRVLGIQWEQVKSLELEISYSDGREQAFEYEGKEQD